MSVPETLGATDRNANGTVGVHPYSCPTQAAGLRSRPQTVELQVRRPLFHPRENNRCTHGAHVRAVITLSEFEQPDADAGTQLGSRDLTLE